MEENGEGLREMRREGGKRVAYKSEKRTHRTR